MLYVLHVALAATAFLVMLNGFLRGARKPQIDAVLSIMLIGLLVVAFAAFGWQAGLLAMVLTFLYAGVGRPLAARAAARLLALGRAPSGPYVGLPGRELARVCQELGRERSSQEMVQEMTGASTRMSDARAALFDYCEGHPEVAQVMAEHGITCEALEELYGTLLAGGAGQWAGGHFVAASALAYPQSLQFLLQDQGGDRSFAGKVDALIGHFERGAPLP